MKKWYAAITMLAVAAAAAGLTLSAASGSAESTQLLLSRVLIGAAVAALAVAAVVRPSAKKAASYANGRGAVPEALRAGCTFQNVAANESALQSLMELKDYLADPQKYARYGARMPRGVLLYGPPGTGKTLLARALAGEAGVPFFAMSGSDFVEKYVGVGAGRVRELFGKARRAGRCVIFIDEIDAMGKRRDEASSDERDQTLNALLSEMSGFYTGDGAVVIAATNRIEALDPALLRPGRFDRQIEVGLPGRNERLSILRLHSRNKPLDGDVNLDEVAAQTISFSGASLESLLNEAAILAARRGEGSISKQDIRAAFYKTIAGPDGPIVATPQERRIIAIHESGHALASLLLAPENRLERVSIHPAGRGAAGYNLCIPAERVMVGKRHIENQICVLLAGRAAEQVVNGKEELTAGASSDIARATELAAAMTMELGMAGEPAVSLKTLNRACGGSGAQEACKAVLNGLYEKACALMQEHAEALSALSEALVEAESLSGGEAAAILNAHLSNERQQTA